MNIARAAKGAASLLMVFGLVALVACQAGPAGTPGAKGDKGDTGAAGAPGAPGTAALQVVGDASERYAILINNGGTDAAPAVGDVTKPATSADVTELFIGGVAPITYAISTAAAGGPFTASIKDNAIVVGKRTGAAGNLVDPGSYTTGTTLAVRATDANGATVTKLVAIRANRKPAAFRGETDPQRNVVVGTQSETYGTGATAKKARNVVHILDLKSWSPGAAAPATAVGLFNDDGTDTSDNKDEDLRDHVIEITKMTRGGDNDPKKAAEHIQVELTAGANGLATNGLKITGLKSTWDSSLNPDAHTPVVVELTAMDPGGLKRTNTIRVYVDGAPQVAATPPPPVHSKKATGTAQILIRDLDSFYKDPEKASGAGLDVPVADVSAEPSQLAAVTIDSGNLSATPNNPGKVTITYLIESDEVGLPQQGPAGSLRTLALSYLGSTGSQGSIDRDGDGAPDTAAAGVFDQYIQGTVTLNVTP